MTDESEGTRARRIAIQEEEAASAILWAEAKQLIRLVIPTVVVQVGLTVPPAMTASYVGRHLGPVALDGFTLATLTGNLLTLALLSGLYSASDTLSPQAFSAGNYKQVGLIAMRGYVGSMLILVPMNAVLFFVMDDLLIYFGQDEEASRLAAQWYRVYIFALPFYALYKVLWKFLSAQEIMMPLVGSMLISVVIILPVCLEWLVPIMGFRGSALAILIYQAAQALLLLAFLAWKKPHHAGTWPGFSWRYWKEAIAWEPFKRYLSLGAGGMLASGEWIWWECISLLIGTLGIIPLSVHTIPTQVSTVAIMVPLGIGTGLAIRVGATLPHNVARAKTLVKGTLLWSMILFVTVSVAMYVGRETIFRLFTSNPIILEGAEEIWWKVVVYYFNICIFGIFTGIATGLGMQWTLGFVNLVFLWFLALPGLYVYAIRYDGGLNVAWTWIYPPYFGMLAILAYKFIVADWDDIAVKIRKREGIENEPMVVSSGDVTIPVSEQTPLLV